MTYDAYLFDLDGTLLDSVALILDSFRHTYRVHFGGAVDDDVWVQGIGTTLRRQLAEHARSPEELEAMIATYVEYNLAQHDALARPFPGAVELVGELARRGKPLAIVTSKMRRGALQGLALMGITEHFDAIITADEVTRGKPDPEPVHLALSRLESARGVRPEPARTLFIGDSPHDIVAGRAADVSTAAAPWGPHAEADLRQAEPTHWLHTLEDVLSL